MGMGVHGYKILTLALAGLFFAGPALAEVPPLEPLKINAKYIVAWNGLTIGRINLTATEDEFGYEMLVDTKTKGFGRLFSDEAQVAQANGRKSDGSYIPARFESRPHANQNRPRTIITYNADGHLLNRDRKPDDDPNWRAPVPVELADTATDPVTAAFILRKKMHDNMALNVRESSVRTYEGARLATMTFKVISRARVEIMDKYVDAINTVVNRAPIAGYTTKEMKKYNEGDPVIHLYFSADGKMIPLRATVDISFGMLSATLTELK